MEKWAESILREWEFIRSCSTAFINELSDAELDRQLPRQGLNTLRKHFQEMHEVQRDYVAAIGSGVMKFTGHADHEIDGLAGKEQLLSDMADADARLKAALADVKEATQILWFGENHLLPGHLAAMNNHEAMHVGQIIAFCYTLDIEIPQYIVKNWALSGR